MGKQIKISDELYGEAERVADAQSVDPEVIVERWARFGKLVVEAAEAPPDNQTSQESVDYADVIRRMKHLMNEDPIRGVDVKKLISDGRS